MVSFPRGSGGPAVASPPCHPYKMVQPHRLHRGETSRTSWGHYICNTIAFRWSTCQETNQRLVTLAFTFHCHQSHAAKVTSTSFSESDTRQRLRERRGAQREPHRRRQHLPLRALLRKTVCPTLPTASASTSHYVGAVGRENDASKRSPMTHDLCNLE